jgi:hypothetical protein
MKQPRTTSRMIALIILVASTLVSTSPVLHAPTMTTPKVTAGTCCW